jgi:hypothetical protein
MPAKSFTLQNRKDFNGCFDQLSRYSGITFCADVSLTIPDNTGVAPFPLNGANRLGLWLEVDSNYRFKFYYDDKGKAVIFYKLHHIHFFFLFI